MIVALRGSAKGWPTHHMHNDRSNPLSPFGEIPRGFRGRRDRKMKYEISNTIGGVILGVYEGEIEQDALDAMAQDAGYKDAADMEATTGDPGRGRRVRQVD